MTPAETEAAVLSEEEFEELEAILVSDDVPADCMNLEMLDGFLAAVLCGPEAIEPPRWLPAVWTADGDEVEFRSGSVARRALTLVLNYHNEILSTMDAEDEAWDPFCYAVEGEDSPALGDEWIAGFEQGLELWPDDWTAGLDSHDAAVAEGLLNNVLKPWSADDAEEADDETRLAWLAASGQAARGLFALWREIGMPAPALADTRLAQAGGAGPGRNDLCPCGSGKKFKKCCGAET